MKGLEGGNAVSLSNSRIEMAMMENHRGELTDLLLREGGVGGRKGNQCSGRVSLV